MLLNIDDGGDGNPARTLIMALQRLKGPTSISKDEDWFLSIRSPNALQPDNVVRILSGDPSKGALSLETEASLVPGQLVQVSRQRLIYANLSSFYTGRNPTDQQCRQRDF